MHLAHQTSAFTLAPHTPISRKSVRMIRLRTEITFSAATPGSRERACHSPLRTAYTCAAVTCGSPCSLGSSYRAAARFGARTTRMRDTVGVEAISQRRESPQPERRLSWRTQQLSGTALASREISTFCGRWSARLGSARSLSLATAASNRSCTCTVPSVGAESQTPCMHQCVHLVGHPAIPDDHCRAVSMWPSGPEAQTLAAGEQGRSIPRR